MKTFEEKARELYKKNPNTPVSELFKRSAPEHPYAQSLVCVDDACISAPEYFGWRLPNTNNEWTAAVFEAAIKYVKNNPGCYIDHELQRKDHPQYLIIYHGSSH